MDDLISRAPAIAEAYDTTREEFTVYLAEVCQWFDSQDASYADVDRDTRANADGPGVFGFRVALKIAESRRIVREFDQEVTITLLNPVYKETGRIQRREEHPHGENSIRCKAEALLELERSSPNLNCRLVVVDDGCPDNSGQAAEAILKSDYPEEFDTKKFQVLFLSDAIDAGDPDLPPGLTHKDGDNRSVKGGAVLYGMRKIVHDKVRGLHIIVDNDADLSIHPAQLGLLIEPIVSGNAGAVAGSRREPDSVALIGGSRNTRGQLFIKIWQHLLPDLAKIVIDTNRAFKAFSAAALAQFLDKIEIYTFPYQIELLQAAISSGVALQTRGIAYVDSEAASTQQGESITETYLNQVHQIIDISKRYATLSQQDRLLRFLEETSEERWAAIENNPPEQLDQLLDA